MKDTHTECRTNKIEIFEYLIRVCLIKFNLHLNAYACAPAQVEKKKRELSCVHFSCIFCYVIQCIQYTASYHTEMQKKKKTRVYSDWPVAPDILHRL